MHMYICKIQVPMFGRQEEDEKRMVAVRKRAVSFLAAAALLLSPAQGAAFSAAAQEEADAGPAQIAAGKEDYTAYAAAQNYPAASAGAASDFQPPDTVLRPGDRVHFTVDIPQDAAYELVLDYISQKTQDLVWEMRLDGAVPFSEAGRLVFPSFWVNAEDETAQDPSFTPEQVLYTKTARAKARDYSGRFEKPYRFALAAGRHTVTLTVSQGECVLEGSRLCAPEEAKPYASLEKQEEDAGAPVAEPIILEGEAAVLKNDRALIPLADGTSPLVHPSHPLDGRLNYTGGSNWSSPGALLSWDFEADHDGYYVLGFHYRQNYTLGGVSYRHLTIDGETPFEEAERIKFVYTSSWKYKLYGDEEPYRIYLKKGKHTLTLTATAGPFSEIYAAMQDITALMGDLYVDITKIVGETVDIYRSYELFHQIPNFQENLDTIIQGLDALASQMESLQESNSGSSVSTVRDAVRVVRTMRDNPYSAHRYKGQFYDAYTNISALMTTMVDMPVDIDRLVMADARAAYTPDKVSLWERISFSFQRFIATYFNDYNTISGSGETEETLTIWVNWGRDQAQALNAVIQDGFVREYGVGVNVCLVNASLIQAILSGKGPDCMIQMARTEPVNLAMRGALVDLSQFADYEEICTRFAPGAATPYLYRDGAYALPDTQGFYMMFARTDVLASLQVDIPQTWDEFITAASVLQRNNLQVSLPYTQITDSGTVNTGVGGLTLYPTLLIQNGLPLYNDEGNACLLTETEQRQMFVEWTDWYTKYKIPKVTNFFNRFRIGSAPLGIASYTLYTQLKAAAPEIDGRWGVFMIPGTLQEDGTLNRSSCGSGTGCAITKLSKNPDTAWSFLRWWTGAETQRKYSNMLESVLGPLGRVSTANLEALKSMDWDADMLEKISLQQALTVELPEIPGGYYTARGIDQAYWNVVELGKKPVEALDKWAAVINEEIRRKKAEYENE